MDLNVLLDGVGVSILFVYVVKIVKDWAEKIIFTSGIKQRR